MTINLLLHLQVYKWMFHLICLAGAASMNLCCNLISKTHACEIYHATHQNFAHGLCLWMLKVARKIYLQINK